MSTMIRTGLMLASLQFAGVESRSKEGIESFIIPSQKRLFARNAGDLGRAT